MVAITISDAIKYSSDADAVLYAKSTPFLAKTITVTSAYTGSWRISFNMMCGSGTIPVYGRIYINGTPYGTLQTSSNFGLPWAIFTQDFSGISIASGAQIQLYGYSPTNGSVVLSYFRIYFDLPPGNASFTSSPTGARIYVDNVDTGLVTPNTKTGLREGVTHDYFLKTDSWLVKTGTFAISSGATTTVPLATLAAASGALTTVSGNVKESNATTVSTGSLDYVLMTEITVATGFHGGFRVSYNAYQNDDWEEYKGTVKICRNTLQIGAEETISAYPEYSIEYHAQDFSPMNIPAGTKIQLYGKSLFGDWHTISVYNLAISYDPPPGSTAFTSSPSVARIWIDNVDTGYDTPSTVPNVVTGTRNWTLKKAGYADVSGTCVVTTGGTVTVPLVTFLASAAFTSNPSVARIWIDSVDKGIDTPGTVTGITAGSRNFTLKKATYLDYNSSFTATAGTTTTVPLATLTPSATTSVIIID